MTYEFFEQLLIIKLRYFIIRLGVVILVPFVVVAVVVVVKKNRVLKEEGDPRWESGKLKPDDGKRDLGELFDEAPSRESYPEYHEVVKHIVDLKTIKRKVWGIDWINVTYDGSLSNRVL